MGVLERVGHDGELRENGGEGTSVELPLLQREGKLFVRGERGRRGGRSGKHKMAQSGWLRFVVLAFFDRRFNLIVFAGHEQRL